MAVYCDEAARGCGGEVTRREEVCVCVVVEWVLQACAVRCE